jgi:hypothetical protein
MQFLFGKERNMNRSVLLSIALGAAFSVQALAQITVSNTFNPAPGTVIVSRQDAAPDSALFISVSSGTGGPTLWDFTNRTFGGGYSLTVVSPGSTPYIDSFPNANVVFQTINGNDTSWTMLQSHPSLFVRRGIVTRGSFGLIITVYRNIASDWVFPVDYNNQWTAYRHWTQYSTHTHTDILDTTYNDVNAWGTVQYRGNSLQCLRVMAHERFTYNTYDSSNTLIYSSSADLYTASFISAGFNTPVTVSKFVQSNYATYSSYASGDFLNGPGAVNEPGTLPLEFNIAQNYPNPFNPTTTIQYDLPEPSDVTLAIFDLLGRKVQTLVDDNQEAGRHVVSWNGGDKPSGIYFYKINAGDFSETRKMELIK